MGNEIIEAAMAQRARYFEFRSYRSLLTDYFRHGARWTAAPKPLMRDELYIEREARELEAGESDTEKRKAAKREIAERDASDQELFDFNFTPLLAESEPVFDAACFTRCGRDIFWQPDLVSNQMGADWLGRHLGPGFRIHRIEFREPTPTHIDTTLVPVRPGLVLINPERPCTNGGMQLFEKNGWRNRAGACVGENRTLARARREQLDLNEHPHAE